MMGGACSTYAGEGQVQTEFCWDNLKWPSNRAGRRWEDNIKMDLQGTGWEGVEYSDVDQDRVKWRDVVNIAMNLWDP